MTPDATGRATPEAPRRRPYVQLSCAMSIDGYIDDASPERLLLSNAEDFDRVDSVRAESDGGGGGAKAA